MKPFRDRFDAGIKLSEQLSQRLARLDRLYAIPRGGVIVALPVARQFHCPVVPVLAARPWHPRQRQFYAEWLAEDSPQGLDLLLVDDGMATGETCENALALLRCHKPRSITLATPCASTVAVRRVRGLCDGIVSVVSPDPSFQSVADYYESFEPVHSDQVIAILRASQPGELLRAG